MRNPIIALTGFCFGFTLTFLAIVVAVEEDREGSVASSPSSRYSPETPRDSVRGG